MVSDEAFEANSQEELAGIARKLHIASSKRHVFLCIGDSCCSQSVGEKAWKALKNILKERELSLSDSPAACFRTKVGCLRVCKGGPILVVYPEGHWYSCMTAERIPEFVERQIVQGEPIPEWIFVTNPLS
ncbi:(2Fe-2S) ferredoxin domain-containing protein [Pirellulaceae bacterium SH449]